MQQPAISDGWVVTGLAASTIYHAGFVLISIVVAHILGWRDHKTSGWGSLWSAKILIMFVASLATFVLLNPFAVLDWRTFIGDLTSHGAMFYSGGYWERGIFYPFTSLIGSIGGSLGYLAVISLVYVLVRRRSTDLILASQPLSWVFS